MVALIISLLQWEFVVTIMIFFFSVYRDGYVRPSRVTFQTLPYPLTTTGQIGKA